MVPDPFQLDDPDDPVSDDEEPAEDEPRTPVPEFGIHNSLNASQVTIAPTAATHEVSLHPSTSGASSLPQEPLPLPQPTPFTPAPAASKPQPALPESDEDEDEPHELYLPGLTIPGLFLPIPNVCDSTPTYTPLSHYSPRQILWARY